MRTYLAALALAGCHTSAPAAPPEAAPAPEDAAADAAGDDSFTIVALPDTQYYNGTYAWVLADQTAWIEQHAADRNIQLVLGLGDIVDGGGPPATGACTIAPSADWQSQWTEAVAAYDALTVPYVLAIGNHDYDCEADRPQPRAHTHWSHYFGQARYAAKPWFTGAFEPGNDAAFYNVVALGGADTLVLALPFYPTNSDLAWADSVLTAHAALPAIVVTHAYLYYDGAGPGTATRVGTGDPDSAGSYKLGPTCPETGITTCGNGNNGTDLWDKLISQHANIELVLSGHFPLPGPGTTTPDNNGVGYRTEVGPLGNRIDQILSDYQGQGRNGSFGNGYLRVYTFHPAQHTLHVETYSPSADAHPDRFPSPGAPPAFKTDAFNTFDLPLP